MIEENFDLEELDEIEDFEIDENAVNYSIWLQANSDITGEDFYLDIDDGYTEITEAEKCFNYFNNKENILEFIDSKGKQLSNRFTNIKLFLTLVNKTDDNTEIIDESEIIL